jgi:hypothetical protein
VKNKHFDHSPDEMLIKSAYTRIRKILEDMPEPRQAFERDTPPPPKSRFFGETPTKLELHCRFIAAIGSLHWPPDGQNAITPGY